MTNFKNISDMKKQPTTKAQREISGLKGFPVPMGKQMTQGPRPKLKFPKLKAKKWK